VIFLGFFFTLHLGGDKMKAFLVFLLFGVLTLVQASAKSPFLPGGGHSKKLVAPAHHSLPAGAQKPVSDPSPAYRAAERHIAFTSRQRRWSGIAGTCVPEPEICDGIDNDCNGIIDDEAIDATLWCEDLDGDGFGGDLNTVLQCEQPPGYTDICGDCADFDPEMHPGAPEICDFIDNNCDGQIDENPEDGITWCRDSDGDNFGDPHDTLFACAEPIPQGYVLDCNDCNDADAGVGPCPDLIFKHGFE